MSMLEELFGVDEADEAEALERVIEGGSDDDERRGDDEAEEDRRTVDPTKPKSVRVVKNPRVVLNSARLTGPRGLQALPEHFKDFKFKGKGREREDLDIVLKNLEHWAHRLYPKFKFDDCLKKIETLGKKRPVMVTMRKIRSDQLLADDIVNQRDSSDDEVPAPAPEDDEFDKLLQQQIELARSTPARGHQPVAPPTPSAESPALMPKAQSYISISEEQRLRMVKYRQVAEERRLARMQQSVAKTHTENDSSGIAGLTNFNSAKQQVSIITDRSEESDNMNTFQITGSAKGITKKNVVPIPTDLPASNKGSDATHKINITDHTEDNLISGITTVKDFDAMDTSNVTENTKGHFHFANTKTKESDAIDTTNTTGNNKRSAIIEKSSKPINLDDATSANTNTANSDKLQQTKVTNTENEDNDSWDGDSEMQDLDKINYGGNQYNDGINKGANNTSKGREQPNYSDSSDDDECQITTCNISVTADVHNVKIFSQDTDKKIENPTQTSKDQSGYDEILECKSKVEADCNLKDGGNSNINEVPVEDNAMHFEGVDDWNSVEYIN